MPDNSLQPSVEIQHGEMQPIFDAERRLIVLQYREPMALDFKTIALHFHTVLEFAQEIIRHESDLESLRMQRAVVEAESKTRIIRPNES